jgi:hypothetical protein
MNRAHFQRSRRLLSRLAGWTSERRSDWKARPIRQSQVWYHEWSVRGCRLRLDGDSLVVRPSKLQTSSWQCGATEPKRILLASIFSIQQLNEVLRISFDTDDEIIVHQRVRPLLEHLPLVIRREGSPVYTSWELIQEMRLRQRVLPPVSWEHGRGRGNIKTDDSVARREIRVMWIVGATLGGVLALKAAVCALTGWWC